MQLIELIKALFIGIVQGVTEWLPVSSTGHMILLDSLLKLDVSEAFLDMFLVVIQLGSILAVLVLFFHRLNPFSPQKSKEERRATWSLWFHVALAIIPSGIVGVLFDDWFDAHLHRAVPVAIALAVYGIVFLFLEKLPRREGEQIASVHAVSYPTALLIGAFQVLSLIPGTSRSGSTILGAMLLGLSRTAAAEFSFFMAIPTMLGAGGIKVLKFALSDTPITGSEWAILAVGCVTAFLVSLAVIRYLMDYVKRHSFAVFGIYRIVLGALILGAAAMGFIA